MIKEYDFYIYPRKLWITCNATPEELNEYFPSGDTDGDKFEELDETVSALVELVGDKNEKAGYLIRFENKDSMSPEIIAHEASHVALYLYNYIGANASLDQEPFAYLMQYIVKCCYDFKESNI